VKSQVGPRFERRTEFHGQVFEDSRVTEEEIGEAVQERCCLILMLVNS
jgi:hypothetical protein